MQNLSGFHLAGITGIGLFNDTTGGATWARIQALEDRIILIFVEKRLQGRQYAVDLLQSLTQAMMEQRNSIHVITRGSNTVQEQLVHDINNALGSDAVQRHGPLTLTHLLCLLSVLISCTDNINTVNTLSAQAPQQDILYNFVEDIKRRLQTAQSAPVTRPLGNSGYF